MARPQVVTAISILLLALVASSLAADVAAAASGLTVEQPGVGLPRKLTAINQNFWIKPSSCRRVDSVTSKCVNGYWMSCCNNDWCAGYFGTFSCKPGAYKACCARP